MAQLPAIPPKSLLSGTSFTMNTAARLSAASAMVVSGGADWVLRIGGSSGAAICSIPAGNTLTDIFYQFQLNLDLPAGTILYSQGQNCFLIFS